LALLRKFPVLGLLLMMIFGRVHYGRRSSSYGELDAFYHAAAAQVEGFCKEHGIDCHIKSGTAD
jgi:hypothetical protein